MTIGLPRTSRPEGRPDDGLDAGAALIAVWLLTMVDVGWSGPLRLLAAFGFAFFVPGRAIVSNWPRLARWSGTGMSIVASLAVLTLLAMIALWAGVWRPLALFQAEAWLSLIGLGVGAARRHRRRHRLTVRRIGEDRGR